MRSEDGSVAVETAIVAPLLLLLMLLVVYAGRASRTDGEVRTAAVAAARAASIAADATTASTAAESTAAANLDDAGLTCTQLDVVTDTGRFTPGGLVTVTVSCQVDNGDIALVLAPGSRWSTATASQPIDRHIGGTP